MGKAVIKVTIGGNAILFCKPDPGLLVKQKPATTAKGETATRRQEAERKLHVDSKGKPGVPTEMLMAAIVAAGVFFKNGKKQVSTTQSTMVTGAMRIREIMCPIKSPEPWDVDTRVAYNNAGGSATLITPSRPRFDNWKISFTLEVNTDLFTIDLARSLVEAAGTRVGIGSFRISRKGPFGSFDILKWDVKESGAEAEEDTVAKTRVA